jgi:lysophospholipase L1-like esterase
MKFSRTFSIVLLLSLASVRADDRPTGPAKWENEIASFEKSDAAKPPAKGGIVFVGSSSIRMWKTLAQDFPEHRVLNRGFGGSEIADSVFYADRIVIPYAPKQVVLYAGGNDIHGGKAPEQVIADFKAFVEKVRAKLPETEIDYISIAGNPSRWAEVEKVKMVNGTIEAWIKEQPRMKFINVFPAMLGADGLPKPDIFLEDRLHMNAAGYAIWKEIVGPLLLR